jgi:hypothetical protein
VLWIGVAVKILGLLMVRNGQDLLQHCLENMAQYCDTVAVINDRSTDATEAILRASPVVGNVVTLNPAFSSDDWFFPESAMLELLLRMADLERPDWVISVDHDQQIEPAALVRPTLAAFPPQVAAVRVPHVSVWNDPDLPELVPIMGTASRHCMNIWRHHPGLRAGGKALHNPRVPVDIGRYGETVTGSWFSFRHHGWDTLAKRIARVDFYTSRDPSYDLNDGVAYDLGLLFGYQRDAVDDLVSEYKRRRLEGV